jgi:hypothetical protein
MGLKRHDGEAPAEMVAVEKKGKGR